MHYLINDTVFEKILKFFMQVKGVHKKNLYKFRCFIEAVHYMLKAGCQWRLLPYYYGSWRAVHKRFKNWQQRGIWQLLFEYFQKDPDIEWVSIDSTIVRAHACAAGYKKASRDEHALGRSRGGFTTKIHSLVDALGNPLKFILTPGQRNDITQAAHLVKNISNTTVIADTAYDANHFRQLLELQQCKAEIPSRENRKEPFSLDDFLYAERHAIECSFGKLKHFRRIFSRFDKSAPSFLAFLHFAGALLWLR